MPTREFPNVTSDWMQITDGTQQAALQVLAGSVFLRDATSKPGKGDKGHLVSGWIVITSPQQAWIRSSSNTANVVVTYS